MAPLSSPFFRNLRWGVLNGLAGAAAFSALLVILAILRGSTNYEQYGTTTWGIVSSYFAAGLVAGIALGILRPITKHWLGILVTAILCSICIYGAVGYAADGRLDLGMAVTLGTLVGGPVGVVAILVDKRKGAN
jgi:hypothetical protein